MRAREPSRARHGMLRKRQVATRLCVAKFKLKLGIFLSIGSTTGEAAAKILVISVCLIGKGAGEGRENGDRGGGCGVAVAARRAGLCWCGHQRYFFFGRHEQQR